MKLADHAQLQALKLPELRAATSAGAASGSGVNADAVFDRLTQKCQTAADTDQDMSGKSTRYNTKLF